MTGSTAGDADSGSGARPPWSAAEWFLRRRRPRRHYGSPSDCPRTGYRDRSDMAWEVALLRAARNGGWRASTRTLPSRSPVASKVLSERHHPPSSGSTEVSPQSVGDRQTAAASATAARHCPAPWRTPAGAPARRHSVADPAAHVPATAAADTVETAKVRPCRCDRGGWGAAAAVAESLRYQTTAVAAAVTGVDVRVLAAKTRYPLEDNIRSCKTHATYASIHSRLSFTSHGCNADKDVIFMASQAITSRKAFCLSAARVRPSVRMYVCVCACTKSLCQHDILQTACD